MNVQLQHMRAAPYKAKLVEMWHQLPLHLTISPCLPFLSQVYKSLVTLATELGITLPSPDEDDDDVAHDDAADGVTQVRQGLSWQEAQLSNPPRTGSSATTATTYNASTSTGHSSSVALYTPAQQ
jgi:hypothetical protein